MSHTPGPWKFNIAGRNIVSEHTLDVWGQPRDGVRGLAWSDADFQLVAAAPDLLAACKAMLLDRTRDDHTSRIAAIAIAKAEGLHDC